MHQCISADLSLKWPDIMADTEIQGTVVEMIGGFIKPMLLNQCY